MTWIRFDLFEPPAPLQHLAHAAAGGSDPALIRTQDLRSVVFFIHGLDCTTCHAVIRSLAENYDRLQECEAQVFAILPRADPNQIHALRPVQVVVDASGTVRRDFADLLEFDTHDKLLLFILDRGGTPSAAWVGDETGEPDLLATTLQHLDYLAIQCPE